MTGAESIHGSVNRAAQAAVEQAQARASRAFHFAQINQPKRQTKYNHKSNSLFVWQRLPADHTVHDVRIHAGTKLVVIKVLRGGLDTTAQAGLVYVVSLEQTACALEWRMQSAARRRAAGRFIMQNGDKWLRHQQSTASSRKRSNAQRVLFVNSSRFRTWLGMASSTGWLR